MPLKHFETISLIEIKNYNDALCCIIQKEVEEEKEKEKVLENLLHFYISSRASGIKQRNINP